MDIYVKLGVANYDLKGDVFVGDAKRVEEDLSAGDSFLYGGGFKLNVEGRFVDETAMSVGAVYRF